VVRELLDRAFPGYDWGITQSFAFTLFLDDPIDGVAREWLASPKSELTSYPRVYTWIATCKLRGAEEARRLSREYFGRGLLNPALIRDFLGQDTGPANQAMAAECIW
jgi:hypothetical protein